MLRLKRETERELQATRGARSNGSPEKRRALIADEAGVIDAIEKIESVYPYI